MPPTGTDIVPVSPHTTMPTELLESKITELAAHIHAATAQWLAFVAEYDRRMAWADWDCKSCAHWLSWRCGLGMKAARDHVRVARSLIDLPLIRHEFESGHFSFSQVRALTRVALPENEAQLVELARSAPAAQLESMVRAFRGAVRAGELTEARRRQVTRNVTYYYDEDGSFVIHARLSPEEGAVVEEALKTFEEELEETGASAEAIEDTLANEAVDELAEEAFSSPELDQRDARAMNERDEARERFFASQLSSPYGRRAADALVALADSALANEARSRSNAERYQVMIHVAAESLVSDVDGQSELADGPSLPPETIRRLGCDCSIVTAIERDGEILSVGRKTRTISTPIKRALIARDRHCKFPGCTSKVWLDGHHIEHWARDEGETKLSNLVLLCRAHHRAVHEYGYSVTIEGNHVTFFRPDGSAMETSVSDSSEPGMVVALNHQAGLAIDSETSVPDWHGDKWDYDVTVVDLLRDHAVDNPWDEEESDPGSLGNAANG